MRLIDANDLFKAITNGEYTTGNIFKDMELQDFIKSIPTAYNIDKVMEQLEEERITAVDAANIFCKPEYDAFVDGMEKAIEIVKKGGVM